MPGAPVKSFQSACPTPGAHSRLGVNFPRLTTAGGRGPLELCMAPLPAPAEKPSHRVSDSQSHAKVRPPTQVAVFCAALWPNLQPALTLLTPADASIRASIAEPPFLAPIHQSGGRLSARNVDAVEQTPLLTLAHRRVDGAFLLDRGAQIRRTGCFVFRRRTCAGNTEDSHACECQGTKPVHRLTNSCGMPDPCSFRVLPKRDRHSLPR